jgi:hypothetical protein
MLKQNTRQRASPFNDYQKHYDGTTSVGAFIAAVDRFIKYHYPSNPDEALLDISLILRGAAERWWNTHQARLTSLEDFYAKFRVSFQESGDEYAVTQRFNECKMKEGERVGVFIDRAMEILSACPDHDLSTKTILNTLHRNLWSTSSWPLRGKIGKTDKYKDDYEAALQATSLLRLFCGRP